MICSDIYVIGWVLQAGDQTVEIKLLTMQVKSRLMYGMVVLDGTSIQKFWWGGGLTLIRQ